MDLEHHQLETRYEELRVRRPSKERQVLSSLATHGQQMPIVVVPGAEDGRYVVIDGHKRLRALKKLGQDVVEATVWDMGEADALLLVRAMRSTESESALEQGWLLAELQSSFGLDQDELARRFDRSASWVSRRLALVRELPSAVQEHVREGRIGAHAAMKHLVPMARAKVDDCTRLADGIATLGLSTREVGELYAAWRDSSSEMRERVLSEPGLFVKSRREMGRDAPIPTASELLRDLDVAGVLVRRVMRKLGSSELDQQEVEQLGTCARQAIGDLERLRRKLDKEETDAELRATSGHPGAAQTEGEPAPDREDPEDFEGNGEEGDPLGLGDTTADRAPGEGSSLPAGDPRPVRELQGESAAGARGADSDGRELLIPSTDGVLPPPRDRHEGEEALWGVPLQARGGDPARHLASPRGGGG
jgi:ParB family chromosome partitioning protein